jgi:HSP20 family protein
MMVRRVYGSPFRGWRSPFQEIEQMRREMDRVFENAGTRPFRALRAGVFPLINVTEDKDHYYVRAELPGLAADELNIAVTGNNLSIAGERKIPTEGDTVKYHRREREAGSFSRIVALPAAVDADKVEAKLVNGILTVMVPKAEAAKPKQITVQ